VVFVEHPDSSDRARSFFNAGELLQLIRDIDGMLSTPKLRPKEDAYSSTTMQALYLGHGPLADAGSLPNAETKEWKHMCENSRADRHERANPFTVDALLYALGAEVTRNDVTLQRHKMDRPMSPGAQQIAGATLTDPIDDIFQINGIWAGDEPNDSPGYNDTPHPRFDHKPPSPPPTGASHADHGSANEDHTSTGGKGGGKGARTSRQQTKKRSPEELRAHRKELVCFQDVIGMHPCENARCPYEHGRGNAASWKSSYRHTKLRGSLNGLTRSCMLDGDKCLA